MGIPSSYSRMGRLSAIITILPSTMGGGWILGYFVVDKQFGTFPWGGIVGALLGAAAGFIAIIRLLLQDQHDRNGQS